MIKVLVVDDSSFMRHVIRTILEREGYFNVKTARDGKEGLAMVKSFKPDVVTLDIQMPVMDGVECLRHIMEECPLPVVMVSSLPSTALETLEALELGAVDFVTKPGGPVSLSFNSVSQQLVRTIGQAARSKWQNARPEAFKPPKPKPAPTPTAPDETSPTSTTGGAASNPTKPAAPKNTAKTSKARGKTTEPAGGSGRSIMLARRDVVLIGASTGGPALVSRILQQLPANFPAPVVVAQHMPATFTPTLAARLDKQCALNVVEARSFMNLQPGMVYIAPGERDLLIVKRDGHLAVKPVDASEEHPWHPSVTRLVESAMRVIPASRILGVMLTGMGDDGAEAMANLRTCGGTTLAESESTAVVWGMPGQLVVRGGASEVVNASNIGQRIVELT